MSILLAHLRAFGSGELKNVIICCLGLIFNIISSNVVIQTRLIRFKYKLFLPYLISNDLVSMYRIELMPSFLTKFWFFSSKSAENRENGYLGFLTILKPVEFS